MIARKTGPAIPCHASSRQEIPDRTRHLHEVHHAGAGDFGVGHSDPDSRGGLLHEGAGHRPRARLSSEARRSSPTTCSTSSRTSRWQWSRPRTTTTASARGCSRPSVTRTRSARPALRVQLERRRVSLPRLHGDLPAGRAGTRPRRVPVAG